MSVIERAIERLRHGQGDKQSPVASAGLPTPGYRQIGQAQQGAAEPSEPRIFIGTAKTPHP